MDTRFWGPSAWRLLHLVAHAADAEPALRRWAARLFALLPYVLPCKYCRASLTGYLEAHPPPTASASAADAGDWPWSRWLYRVHNLVNAKLKEQGHLDAADPAWADVHATYVALYASACTRTGMLGWDFLASVAYTTPLRSRAAAAAASSPMPDAPPRTAAMSLREANRHNLLTREERIQKLAAWWRVLGRALPLPAWRAAWAAATKAHGAVPPLAQGPRAVTAWVFHAERAVCAALAVPAPPHCDKFKDFCAELAAFSSGCGAARRGTTCRAQRAKAARRAAIRRTRRRAFRQSGGFL